VRFLFGNRGVGRIHRGELYSRARPDRHPLWTETLPGTGQGAARDLDQADREG
jgi:hypothetical protein